MKQTIITNEEVKQTNLSSFALWDNASIIILNTIMNKINNFQNYKDFLAQYKLDDKEAIDLLNQCYIYEPNIKIPLLNDDMILFSNLKPVYSSDNIDDDIINFIISVNKKDQIKSELAHSGIIHPNIRPYNSSQIVSKIFNSTNSLCINKELKENSKIMELILKINHNVLENNTNFKEMNEVDQEKLLIFGKLFVSNLGPRLRELENPSESVKKRWAWELIQNAKDTIVSDTNKKVDITFTYDKKHLIYQHNGNDFTLKQYLALVYKFSEDKHDQKGSIGRFGCGFLTTHIISKKVILKGNLKNENKLTGFEVTLDRTGHNDHELEESTKRTEESKIFKDKPFNYTSFEYQYNSEEQINRVNMGIENLKKNLPLVLIFSPNINTVVIKNLDKNEEIKYSLDSKTKNIINIKISNNNETQIRRFIYFYTERDSQHLSQLYYPFGNKKIHIEAVLEIDHNNKIISHHDNESIYCVFPLIGSKLRFPFVLNSPEFETYIDRNGIFLKDSPENVSTYDEINKEILKISLELYENIIKFCIENNYSFLFYLADGLKCQYEKEEHFYPDIFSNIFLKEAQKILISYPVFKTCNGFKLIKDVTLVNYSYPNNETVESTKLMKYKKDLYSLYKYVYTNPIDFEESIKWPDFLMDGFNYINYVDILNKISGYNQISNLPLKSEIEKIQFINDTLDFVFEYDKAQFRNIKLIPNQYLQFCNNSNMYFAPDIFEVAINLLHRLNYDWRKNHVFQKIKVNNYLPLHKIPDTEEIIKKLVNHTNAKILMEYIIPNNQIRIKMHYYSVIFLGIPKNEIELPCFSNNMWRTADDIIMNDFINIIENLNSIRNPVQSVEFLSDLIDFLLENGMPESTLKSHCIFPNTYGKFLAFSKIFIDGIKYEDIKNALYKYCQINIQNILIHQQFKTKIKFNQIFVSNYFTNIENFYYNSITNIENCYQRNTYYYNSRTMENDKKEFSLILFKYVTDEMTMQQNQKDLINCYNTLSNTIINEIPLQRCMNTQIFKYVSEDICFYINQHLQKNTIDKLLEIKCVDKNTIIKNLNILYKFIKKDPYVPNRKGIFCFYEELVYLNHTEIDDITISLMTFEVSIKELLNNQSKCTKEEVLDYYVVMDGIVCPHINKNNYIKIEEICKRIDSLIYNKYDIIIKSDNIELKIMINDLINFLDSRNYWHFFKKTQSKRDSLIAQFIVTRNDRDLILRINKLPKDIYNQILKIINDNRS